jgi:GAF domain-containing protein
MTSQEGSMVTAFHTRRSAVQRDVQNPDVAQLLQGLATTLANAEQLLGDLESAGADGGRCEAAPAPDGGAVARGLERRLAAAERDRQELTRRLVAAERRAERLMTLYVATYHLHAALDPAAVEAAIAEIAVDLLGARSFALLLRDGDGCRVAMARGIEGEADGSDGRWSGGRYGGGDAMVDATLADGTLRLAPGRQPGGEVLAAVPLNLGEQTAGALVILELHAQKRALTVDDRDLLDVLAAHAASALTAAQLFAVKERKLRSLTSLIELARTA